LGTHQQLRDFHRRHLTHRVQHTGSRTSLCWGVKAKTLV
jgi:hypothetical protein